MKLGKYFNKQGIGRQRYGCINCKEDGKPWTFYDKINSVKEKCPYCGNTVKKRGIINGKQRFFCDNCKNNKGKNGKTFYIETTTLKGIEVEDDEETTTLTGIEIEDEES